MYPTYFKLLGYLPFSRRHPYLSRIWSAFIFLVVSSPLVLALIKLALTGQQILLSSIFFNLIIPIHYILGIRYIRRTHFRSVLADCRRFLIPIPTELKMSLIILGVMVTSTICLIVIMEVTQKIPMEYELIRGLLEFSGSRGLVTAWSILEWVLSAFILSTNLVIFSLVFYKHLRDIKNLRYYLESKVIWQMDQASFIGLTRRIVGLRFVINQSVDHLESFYTFMTVLGAIAMGPILEFKILDPYLIYFVVVYGICQIIFTYFIYFISKNRQDILKVIKSPTVMFKYLTNVKNMNNVSVLRAEAKELLKFNPERTKSINKFKIAAYSPVRFEEDDDLEKGSEIDAELLTLSYKNNAAIDWMILHETLNEKWASFNLMGISFDDGGVIKKSVGMMSLIILASSYFNSLSLI